jgi:hypothetical protein
MSESDASRYVSIALDDPNPDTRRDTIEHLAETRFAQHDIVLDACRIVARTDPSESVRCAAVRLLSESGDPGAATTLIEILQSSGASARVGERVRLTTVRGLERRARDKTVPPDKQDAAVAVAIRLLEEDPSRDVQIEAATLLGEFPRLAALNALISALNNGDFGVVYHAERSLMRLTGVSHDHDPHDWRAWLTQVEDPFANRGALDDQLTPVEPKNWWQRTTASMKRVLSGFRPKQQDG